MAYQKPQIWNHGVIRGCAQALCLVTAKGFLRVTLGNFDWIAGAREQVDAMKAFPGECLYVE